MESSQCYTHEQTHPPAEHTGGINAQTSASFSQSLTQYLHTNYNRTTTRNGANRKPIELLKDVLYFSMNNANNLEIDLSRLLFLHILADSVSLKQ